MAITATLLTNNFQSDAGPWVTASVSPSGFVLLGISITEFGGGTAPTSLAASGCGLTWTTVDHVDNATSLVSCWVLKGLGTPSAGAITVTPTGGTSLKEANWSVIDVGGADPAPIVQSVNGTAASASPQVLSLTLAALGDAVNNAVFMFTGGGSTAAAGAGYTELSDSMNNVSMESQWKLPGTTTPSCTGDSNFFGQAGVALEVKASAGASGKSTTITLSPLKRFLRGNFGDI